MPLEGKLVILREERREDLDMLQELRNDMETQAWSKSLPPDYTEPMYVKRFEAREFSYDPGEGRFTIVYKEPGTAVLRRPRHCHRQKVLGHRGRF
jgi:RimJ/RimL family protein N-acetyltransferase